MRYCDVDGYWSDEFNQNLCGEDSPSSASSSSPTSAPTPAPVTPINVYERLLNSEETSNEACSEKSEDSYPEIATTAGFSADDTKADSNAQRSPEWCIEEPCDEIPKNIQDVDAPKCECYVLLLVLICSVAQFFKIRRQLELKQKPVAYSNLEQDVKKIEEEQLLLKKPVKEKKETKQELGWEFVKERKIDDRDDFVIVN